ncbi:hypothetical protein ACWGK1_01610 [Streptomyces wedmorensis]
MHQRQTVFDHVVGEGVELGSFESELLQIVDEGQAISLLLALGERGWD